MKAARLQYENLNNPIGIDRTAGIFKWQLSAEGYGKQQSAYQVRCSEIPDQWEGKALLWKTGKIVSSDQINIRYLGQPLKSRQRVYWQVKVWDENGIEGPWSEPAFFELGLLEKGSWKAKWIDPQPEAINNRVQYPASILKKRFNLSNPIEKARLYITSHGIYRASINGKPVSNALLTPGCTNYHSRLQVQTWDIKDLLRPGENRIEVVLGDGWYRGRIGVVGKRNVYGERLALLAQMEIISSDGSLETIVTDESWTASQDGPLRLNDLKDGEVFDARKKVEKWHEVLVRDYGYDRLIGTNSPMIVEKERFTSEVITTPNGETVLDFGQNLVGYVAFSVEGPRGHQVKLTHGEVLDENGNFTLKNLLPIFSGQVPLAQEIHYILEGGERESYKPSFTFHGFRYVLVENWPEPVSPKNFEAVAVYSDLEETGSFSCSNARVNQLVSNALWSQKGNFVDIPTDCPQRERAGWTGDIQVFCRTGSFFMDLIAFLKKWLLDLKSHQQENGMVLNIVPSVGMDTDSGYFMKRLEGSAGWGDAAVIVPWTLWKMYGDSSVLEDQWESMKAWVDYEAAQARKTHWVRCFKRNPYRKYTWDTKYHWGEWLEPGKTIKQQIPGIAKRFFFSEPEVATAYFAYSSALLAEVALALGKEKEAKKYKDLSENAKKAYRYNFIPGGKIRSDRQCRYIRPVVLDLLEDEKKQAVVDELAELVIRNDYKIGTGFLSTPYVCRVLSDYGHTDIAYKMVLQTSMPGWLYEVTKGATTIWETWPGIDEKGVPTASHNHYSYGAVVSWFFDTIAGIDIDLRYNDSNRFILAPKPGKDLQFAKCSYLSVVGPISSEWVINEKYITFTFSVPPNCAARLVLPCGDLQGLEIEKGEIEKEAFRHNKQGFLESDIGSGEYRFRSPLKTLDMKSSK